MVDESFFLTVAGIAMSFAGFAGLMNTLRRRGEAWAPMGSLSTIGCEVALLFK